MCLTTRFRMRRILLLLADLYLSSVARRLCLSWISGSRGIITFSRCTDLELCKVGENLLQISASQTESLYSLVLLETCQAPKSLWQSHITAINVDSVNSVAHFNGDFDLDSLNLGLCHNMLFKSVLILRTIENQFSSRDLVSDQIENACLLVPKLSSVLSQFDRVATAVLCRQIVRRTEDNKPAVDHDSDLVTKLLSFIHPVSSQENWRHFHLLDHAVERSAWDRVDTSRRLIQKKNLWAKHERLRAA